MKTKFLKFKSWLLGALLGSLGLGGCHCAKNTATPEPEPATPTAPTPLPDTTAVRRPQPRDEIRLMYGVPTVDFHVRGQVISPNGKPVEGVEVMLLEEGMDATPDTIYGNPESIRRYSEKNAIRTDNDGRFELKTSRIPRGNLKMLVRDVDGKRNGTYKNQLLDLGNDTNVEISVNLEKK
ncbi:MAG: radical SAM-associated putative lipoprotein [Bacteroidales bacterium]|nr:radical SAM-associated putative lipoprotein [Bacteroidales bacterium]